MEDEKLLVTMKDIQRYRVFKDVIAKKLKGIEAAEILNLTPVHVSRLKKKLLEGGFEAMLRKPPKHPSNQKVSDLNTQKILKLRRDIYYDFNIMHLKDKLDEIHKIHLSYETLRQILIHAKEHHPKKKKKVHRQRRRMPKAGMLIQMDSSQHFWLPLVESKWWLTAMIDDATNEVPYAQFFPKDTAFSNMHVLRHFIEIKGVFMSLYVDKASHFKTTRYGGLHYNVTQEQEETQIERALNELGINIIPANSPQAKGRIEVTFRLFQDRLIKEMRLAGIKNYSEANRFLLQQFLPWYNAKYTHQAESAYTPLPKDKNLDIIFCIKKERAVQNDNTIQINGQIIQIPPSNAHLSFARRKVDVCILQNERIFILYKDSIICKSKLSKNNKIHKKEKQIENLLNLRDYSSQPRKIYVPPPDHPWRKPIYGNAHPSKNLNSKINILK